MGEEAKHTVLGEGSGKGTKWDARNRTQVVHMQANPHPHCSIAPVPRTASRLFLIQLLSVNRTSLHTSTCMEHADSCVIAETCLHACTHTHTNTHIYTYAHHTFNTRPIYTCVFVHTYAHAHIHMHTYTHTEKDISHHVLMHTVLAHRHSCTYVLMHAHRCAHVLSLLHTDIQGSHISKMHTQRHTYRHTILREALCHTRAKSDDHLCFSNFCEVDFSQ